MIAIGIDLSGPSNHADTAMIWARGNGSRLTVAGQQRGASDFSLLQRIRELAEGDACVIGIDAPLSYNDGGGLRDSDSDLKRSLIAIGLRSGTVMPPTLTKMCYLTLRGMSLSRSIALLPCKQSPKIIETHPGAVFGLHQAPLSDVLGFATNRPSRRALLNWLKSKNVRQLPPELAETSHQVAACGAMYGAWKWACEQSRWSFAAQPPQHPYVFAC